MREMLAGPLTSLAFCWRVERRDGAGFGLTSHDATLAIGGIEFNAESGMLPASVERSLGIEESDGDIAGAITSAALEEGDLVMGRWDGARVSLVAVDWESPDADAVALLGGEIGEVRIEDDRFNAGLRGASAKLSRSICPETSSECRAELGDKQCRIDMAARTMQCMVGTVDGNALMLDQAVDDNYLWGRARFLTGENTGLTSVVVAITGNRIELRDTMRGEMVAGDRILLREGCDKMFATCTTRFDNGANFRGEPHLPGNDLLTRYPGA